MCMKWHFAAVLIEISLGDNEVKHIFLCAWTLLASFSLKLLFVCFAQFSIRRFGFY